MADDAPKAKKPKKLVPIVHGRHRRTHKKESASKFVTQPRSAAFQELMEAAHHDAEWERGRTRPRHNRSNWKSNVAFGVAAAPVSKAEKRQVVWPGVSEIKTEVDAKKEEMQDVAKCEIEEDPFRPTMIPIGQLSSHVPEGDSRKLLPQYIESRLDEVDSDVGCEEGTAEAMGLTGASEHSDGILFQLPSAFPLPAAKAEDGTQTEPGNVSNLPEGRIGKLRIYRSGRVRLKIGEILMDVNSGTPWPFYEQLVAINVQEDKGHCVFLGDIKKRAVCTLNVSQLLQTESGERVVQKRKLEIEEDDQDVKMVDVEPTNEDLMETDEMKMDASEQHKLTPDMRKLTVERPTTFTES